MARDTYAIWDLESGNLVAGYDSEREALELVRAQIREYGEQSVRQWDLSRERRGRLTSMAEGEALVQRAIAQVQHVEHSVGR